MGKSIAACRHEICYRSGPCGRGSGQLRSPGRVQPRGVPQFQKVLWQGVRLNRRATAEKVDFLGELREGALRHGLDPDGVDEEEGHRWTPPFGSKYQDEGHFRREDSQSAGLTRSHPKGL